MKVLVITGTGTGIGKTVVTAAIAALAPSVTVVKPAQTGVTAGEAGDLQEVVRRAGAHVRTVELARYPDPLSPEAAARRVGAEPLSCQDVTAAVQACSTSLVLVEGAGGLLVRFSATGHRGTRLSPGRRTRARRHHPRAADAGLLQRLGQSRGRGGGEAGAAGSAGPRSP